MVPPSYATLGALVTGAFGMNLYTGLTEERNIFMLVVYLLGAVTVFVTCVMVALFWRMGLLNIRFPACCGRDKFHRMADSEFRKPFYFNAGG
jgi:hypothetical protein